MVELKKIKVEEAVFNGLKAVLAAELEGITQTQADAPESLLVMSEVNLVIEWLHANGFAAAGTWVRQNLDPYCRGLVKGFEVGAPDCLKRLADYTDEEKCAEFDKLYRMAEEDFNHVRRHGCPQKDSDHWMFEAVMYPQPT